MEIEVLRIGRFRLSRGYNPERIWIGVEGGEGGDFNEEELEKLIAEFYNENF